MKTLGPYDPDDGRYRIRKHAQHSWRTDCGKRLVGHASTWEAAMYLAEHDMRAVRDRIRTLISRPGFQLPPTKADYTLAAPGDANG